MAKILIIDDDRQLCGFLHELLTENGHEVLEATDGEQGLELYKKFAADIIIVDLFMPKKGGVMTIVDLRIVNPGVKIIAISGGGVGPAIGHLSVAKHLGADHVLAKPFRHDELLDLVAKLSGELVA